LPDIPSCRGTTIQVVLDSRASYCAEVEATCSVEMIGSVIHLTASGSEVRDTSGADYPTACQPVIAECSLPADLVGARALRYGDRTAPIELPVERPRSEVLPVPSQTACGFAPVPE
jgi:hypothetical protein